MLSLALRYRLMLLISSVWGHADLTQHRSGGHLPYFPDVTETVFWLHTISTLELVEVEKNCPRN